MNIELLNLQTKKVTQSTVTLIDKYLYDNRNVLTNELKLFYIDAKAILEHELKKCKTQRLHMDDILERAYNIEEYVLAAGAASYEVEFENS